MIMLPQIQLYQVTRLPMLRTLCLLALILATSILLGLWTKHAMHILIWMIPIHLAFHQVISRTSGMKAGFVSRLSRDLQLLYGVFVMLPWTIQILDFLRKLSIDFAILIIVSPSTVLMTIRIQQLSCIWATHLRQLMKPIA